MTLSPSYARSRDQDGPTTQKRPASNIGDGPLGEPSSISMNTSARA